MFPPIWVKGPLQAACTMRWSRPSPAGFPMNTAEDRRLHLQNLGVGVAIGIGIDIPTVRAR